MKVTPILLLSLMFTLSSIAQTEATEAKAAYLLAEESFASRDWKGALSYLEECRKKIGKPNSKILYLQIMTELELSKTDTSFNKAVLKTIIDFEKAFDIKDFNEEKTMEVMKAKLRLNRKLEALEKDKAAMEELASWKRTLGGVVVVEKDRHGFVMAKEDIGKMNFEDAIKACEDLVLNGFSDWRLPTVEEMQLIFSFINQLVLSKTTTIEHIPLKSTYWSKANYDKKVAKQMHNVRPVRSF